MGFSKQGSKYLNWSDKAVGSIVTRLMHLVGPLSRTLFASNE